MKSVVLALVLTVATVVAGSARADDEPEPAARSAGTLGYGIEMQQQMRSAAWRHPAGAPFGLTGGNALAPVLVMGVSVRTGERSRLAWQTPLAVSDPAAAGGSAAGQRSGDVQLAWTLRSRDPALAAFRGSPFKYALSGQTVVTLKPRKSKVSVTLQHQW